MANGTEAYVCDRLARLFCGRSYAGISVSKPVSTAKVVDGVLCVDGNGSAAIKDGILCVQGANSAQVANGVLTIG